MSNFTDLPGELIGEILNYLGHLYNEARLAQTCKQMNNRIWKFRKHLQVPEEIFEQYFATTEFNFQRYIGLDSLIIPKISPQITQLPHLTYLNFKYDGSADEATIINQLTHLYSLYIDAEDVSVTNLNEMISENHQLTNLTLYSASCSDDLFQLPIMSRLKAFTFCPQIFEEKTLEELFNMTNLRKLSIESIQVKDDDTRHFSRLVNLQEIALFNVMFASGEHYVNFEEFGALKNLTRLKIHYQRLREEDFKGIGTLTSLEYLDVAESENIFHLEYLCGLTNLTRLELYDDPLYDPDQSMQFKYLTKLEHLATRASDTLGQLQYLPRLKHLAILTKMTADQANHIGLVTQLRNLDISCGIDKGQVYLRALVNVTALTMFVPYSLANKLDEQLRLYGAATQLKNVRLLEVGDTVHKDMFDSVKQLTHLVKLNIDCKKSEFAHESWDLAALPFEVEFNS